MTSRQETQKRAMVARMERGELEDQHLRILEENAILKAHGRKQEEKIKKMATKLIRLVNDRKKQVAQGTSVRRTARDVSLEETIENQQDVIRQLNKENELLKQKLQLAQQQMHSQGKRNTPYSRVPSKIDSGKAKRRDGSPDTLRSHGKSQERISFPAASPPPTRYGHSLLEEARNENHHLQQQMLALQDRIASMQDENDSLHTELLNFRSAHENDVLKFREHVTSTQRSTVSENIELIKLQRQMKEKSTNFTAMEGRFQELQRNYNQLRSSYEKVLHEVERLKSQLLEEEDRSIQLQNQLKQGGSQQRRVGQMQEHIRDLEKEVEILKDANEKLVDSAFDQEKEHQWRQLERKLRVQIGQLEAAMKSDMADKNDYLAKMENERGFASRLHSDSRKVHEEGSRLRKENEELRERLRVYSMSDDIVDVDELREALAKVRQKRHAAAQKERPDFLQNVDDEDRDPQTQLVEMQVQHAETIQELEKTREMLLMQHKINKDYQIEVDSVSSDQDRMRREYEEKLDRFARLLDARLARIKKLESQLHDVAYGTKQFKLTPDDTIGEEEELDESVHLERGENLFEIHITKMSLSKEALVALDDREPSLFVTYAFYDYELVSTPILKSASPLFDFTAQFTIKVDDLFLHHIQKEKTIFEVHQALGVEHKTIASCRVKFNQLLDQPQGKMHGTVALTGLDGSNYGTLDFWVRLRVPMEQAIRLYRERTKALGYLSANTATTKKALDDVTAPEDPRLRDTVDNTNQLLVQIMTCNHVEARRQGVQPSVYCIYKFFDFADHDTPVIPHSNNPHFDDRQAFPLQMDANLDSYLKSEKLVIYVFDDADPGMPSYLGKAVIDLIPLAHNKVIKAPFQLVKSNGEENGTVEVCLRWRLPYSPPASLMTSQEIVDAEEKEIQESQKLATKPPVTPKKRTLVSRLSRPFSASTPKPTKEQPDDTITTPADDTITTKPMKKVSIIEPVKEKKEKPVPMARSIHLPAEKPDSRSPEASDDGAEEVEEEDIEEEIIQSASKVHGKDEDDVDGASDDESPPGSVEEHIPTKDVSLNPSKDDADMLEDMLRSQGDEDDEGSLASEKMEEDMKRSSSPPPIVVAPSAALEKRGEREVDESEEEDEDEDDIEEEIDEIPGEEEEEKEDEDEQEGSGNDEDTDVIMVGARKSPETKEEEQDTIAPDDQEDSSDTVTISINHLTLGTNTSVWNDVEQVFVEYDFLGSVKEMPESVTIDPAQKDKKININFQSITEVDASGNQEQRESLSKMLATGKSSFKVTVVSEPINDEEDDCDEIGTASVDLADILQTESNIRSRDVNVHDLNEPHYVIGKLNVDVKALGVLRRIQDELKAKLREHS